MPSPYPLSERHGRGIGMGNLLASFARYFKIDHLVLLVPICGFALYDSVFQSFSSILAALSNAYPDVPVTAIQTILTIPPMVSIPGTLLSGFLVSYVPKKHVAQFALGIIFVGGMIPLAFKEPSIGAMFACSVCIGLGQGLLHPLASSFVCQVWSRQSERGRALGFKQSFNYVGGALVSLAVGYLALAHWKNAFLIYVGIIPIMVLTQILLPKGKLDQKIVSRHSFASGWRELLNARTVYLFGLLFFAMAFLYTFHTNIALLVQDKGLGTTADVSKITFAVSIASFAVGLLYGKILKMMGRYTLAVGFAFLSIGFVTVVAGSSLEAVIAGGALFGIGTGIQEISTIYYISVCVKKELVTMAISVGMSCIALGASVSPILLSFLEGVLFGAGTPAATLLMAACGCAVLVAIEGSHSYLRLQEHRANHCSESSYISLRST